MVSKNFIFLKVNYQDHTFKSVKERSKQKHILKKENCRVFLRNMTAKETKLSKPFLIKEKCMERPEFFSQEN